MIWALLGVSLVLNGVLTVAVVWQRRRVKHLAAVEVVNEQLGKELERKYGARKALRVVRSAGIQIGQRMRRREA